MRLYKQLLAALVINLGFGLTENLAIIFAQLLIRKEQPRPVTLRADDDVTNLFGLKLEASVLLSLVVTFFGPWVGSPGWTVVAG